MTVLSRNVRTALTAVACLWVIFFLLLTLLVRIPGISWHGHLFGLLAGVFAAWLTRAMGKGKATAPTAQG